MVFVVVKNLGEQGETEKQIPQSDLCTGLGLSTQATPSLCSSETRHCKHLIAASGYTVSA